MRDSGFLEQRIKEEVNLLMSMQGLDRLFLQAASVVAHGLTRGCHVFFTGEGPSEDLARLLARHWQNCLFGTEHGEELISSVPCGALLDPWPGRAGDILVACAPSVPGMELLRTLTKAGEEEMTIMALTGAEPWLISGLSTLCLCVPSTNPLRASEQMLFLGNGLAETARELMTKVAWQDQEM